MKEVHRKARKRSTGHPKLWNRKTLRCVDDTSANRKKLGLVLRSEEHKAISTQLLKLRNNKAAARRNKHCKKEYVLKLEKKKRSPVAKKKRSTVAKKKRSTKASVGRTACRKTGHKYYKGKCVGLLYNPKTGKCVLNTVLNRKKLKIQQKKRNEMLKREPGKVRKAGCHSSGLDYNSLTKRCRPLIINPKTGKCIMKTPNNLKRAGLKSKSGTRPVKVVVKKRKTVVKRKPAKRKTVVKRKPAKRKTVVKRKPAKRKTVVKRKPAKRKTVVKRKPAKRKTVVKRKPCKEKDFKEDELKI